MGGVIVGVVVTARHLDLAGIGATRGGEAGAGETEQLDSPLCRWSPPAPPRSAAEQGAWLKGTRFGSRTRSLAPRVSHCTNGSRRTPLLAPVGASAKLVRRVLTLDCA